MTKGYQIWRPDIDARATRHADSGREFLYNYLCWAIWWCTENPNSWNIVETVIAEHQWHEDL